MRVESSNWDEDREQFSLIPTMAEHTLLQRAAYKRLVAAASGGVQLPFEEVAELWKYTNLPPALPGVHIGINAPGATALADCLEAAAPDLSVQNMGWAAATARQIRDGSKRWLANDDLQP